MRKIKAALTVSTLFVLAGTAVAAGVIQVNQKNLAFSSDVLRVSKGTKVEFQNSDATAHNILITGPGLVFNSGLQRPGVAFTAPFGKPGTYKVNCGIHPKMKMAVVVK